MPPTPPPVIDTPATAPPEYTAVTAASNPPVIFANNQPWTRIEDKEFERLLVLSVHHKVDELTRLSWIAHKLGGIRTVAEVEEHYMKLVHDIVEIDSGRVSLPRYDDDDNNSAELVEEDRHEGSMSAPSDQKGKRERKKVSQWSEDEHRLLLIGLKIYKKGDWRSISRNLVKTRSPTQVASHAQKYQLRQTLSPQQRRRSSIHDIEIDKDSVLELERRGLLDASIRCQLGPEFQPSEQEEEEEEEEEEQQQEEEEEEEEEEDQQLIVLPSQTRTHQDVVAIERGVLMESHHHPPQHCLQQQFRYERVEMYAPVPLSSLQANFHQQEHCEQLQHPQPQQQSNDNQPSLQANFYQSEQQQSSGNQPSLQYSFHCEQLKHPQQQQSTNGNSPCLQGGYFHYEQLNYPQQQQFSGSSPYLQGYFHCERPKYPQQQQQSNGIPHNVQAYVHQLEHYEPLKHPLEQQHQQQQQQPNGNSLHTGPREDNFNFNTTDSWFLQQQEQSNGSMPHAGPREDNFNFNTTDSCFLQQQEQSNGNMPHVGPREDNVNFDTRERWLQQQEQSNGNMPHVGPREDNVNSDTTERWLQQQEQSNGNPPQTGPKEDDVNSNTKKGS